MVRSSYGYLTSSIAISLLFFLPHFVFSQEVSVEEYNIKALIENSTEYCYKRNEQPSSLLIKCSDDIKNGLHSIPIDTLVSVLPDLLSYIDDVIVRSSRPDGQLASDPDAIAGNSCDLTQVLRLLGIIRSRIGTVYQDPDSGTVLGTLGNPLELGPGLNIVRKLLRIQGEFRETWTILANLTCNATATVDLSGVYTAIANISCVATATVDLSGVYTSLADIRSTLTACCATINNEFQQTWTILANLSCNVTATTDLSGVFTALNACCTDLKSTISADFRQTWTILTDLKNTLTACCATINSEFQQTWTILANLTFNATATTDLSGVYTALAACCADLKATMSTDFNQTWTILSDIKSTLTSCCATINNEFQQTWTILANLTFNATATTDLSGVYTSLADIRSTLTACCATINSEFQQTWTILNDLRSTLTIGFACGSPIAITGPTTISLAGSYCLANDIVGTITINADRVFLDLNQKRISGGINNIEVLTGRSEIDIGNGFIQNASQTGISVNSAVNVSIHEVDFTSNVTGIVILSSQGVSVKNCVFRNHTGQCMRLGTVSNGEITSCSVLNNTNLLSDVIAISSSTCLQFADINICGNTLAGNLTLFLITSSRSISFKQCMTDNNNPSGSFSFAAWSCTSCNDLYFEECSCVESSGVPLTGILINTSNIVTLDKIDISRCGGTASVPTATLLFGLNIVGSNGVTVSDSMVNLNGSSTSLNAFLLGYLVNGSTNVTLRNCVTENSTILTNFAGFTFISTNNGTLVNCESNRNTIVGDVLARGFSFVGCQSISLINSNANTNSFNMGGTPPASSILFAFATSEQCTLIGCQAKSNTMVNNRSITGILLDQGCQNIVCKNCLIEGNEINTDGVNATLRGIYVDSAALYN